MKIMEGKLLIVSLVLCASVMSCQKMGSGAGTAGGRISPRLVSGGITTKGEIVTGSGLNVSGKQFRMDAWLGSTNRYNGSHDGRVYDANDKDNYHFISNETVSYASGSWTMTNGHYWRKSVPTSFWSLYPTSVDGLAVTWPGEKATDEEQKKLSFTYTIPNLADGAGAEGQPDLCVAFSYKTWTDGSDNIVDIDFKHALSAVLFDVTGIPEGITVTKIAISGLKGGGTCTVTGSTDGTGSSKDVTFAWTTSGGNCNWSQSFVDTDFETVSGRKVTKAGSKKIFMLIPQTLTADTKLAVTFNDGTNTTTKEKVIGDGSTTFKAGKKYTFKLSVKDGVLSAEIVESYNGKPLGGNILNSNGLNPYNGYPLESHEYVEIGGLKWATMNIGATKPEECGYYFAWGETTGHKANSAKTGFEDSHSFNWANTPFNNGQTSFNSTYFNNKTEWLDGNATDGYTLKPEYDAAHVLWGGNWRMPTDAEFTQLINDTSHTWTSSYNGSGISGYIFTSTADKSKSIFLPVSGYAYNTSPDQVKTTGWYWSSSLYNQNNFAWHLHIYSGSYAVVGNERSLGMCIRPVSN